MIAAGRTFSPDPKGIGSLTDGWSYDLLGRAKTASKAGGGTETRGYDPAGKATTITTPRGDQIAMTGYDALNRPRSRSFGTKAGAAHTTTLPFWPAAIPYGYTAAADADTFAYAPGGQVRRALNCDAYVGRAIHASELGRVDFDTLKVRTATGACYTYGHTYVVGYTYDNNNRRATMTAPAIFPGTAIGYGYNVALGGGRLTSVTDIGGNLVSFGYKASGELQTVTYPGSVVRTLGYND